LGLNNSISKSSVGRCATFEKSIGVELVIREAFTKANEYFNPNEEKDVGDHLVEGLAS